MPDLHSQPCWTAARADEVLQTLALVNDKADFLAVHQPIRDFQLTITSGRTFAPTEEGLLEALSDPATRYAFCVVEGEPGSGKSHLIRWLGVKWNPEDLVLLIERADGSLIGTLRQLREQLGSKYERFFEHLSSSVEATFEGRVSLFHTSLAASLRSGFFQKPVAEEDWCDSWEIARLVGHPTIVETWKSPERILRIMSGDGGQRNQGSADFDLYDVADLANAQSAVEGLPPRALMFLRTLKKECDRFAPARAEGVSAEALELDESLELPQARRLLRALNARRDFAVQGVLGITADGLKTMFLNLRKELRAEQRRLVLLLEDVTSWEGIDGQLIDALTTHSVARDDVCDMVSVVGMTPRYLRNLQGNYGARISYTIRLGRERREGGYQETIQLAAPEAQVEFASRYLQAIRIDRPRLEDWYEAGAEPDALWNRCAECPERKACFSAFGEVNGVGLFPFNHNAITNTFRFLSDPTAHQSLQTPRGMIQGVLSPVLLHPHRLAASEFPPEEIEASEWMPPEPLQPSGFLDQVIRSTQVDAAKQGQLRRLMMLWSDRSRDLGVHQTSDGVRDVDGVAEGVFRAFDLPWLGDLLGPASTTTDPQQTRAPTAGGTVKPAQGPDHESGSDLTRPRGPEVQPRRPTEPRPTTGTGRMSGAKLAALLEPAKQWRDGKTLKDSSIWEPVLTELMAEVRKLLPNPAPAIWDRVFTRETVRLEGIGRADSRHFVIPREEWATRGLEAFLELRSGAELGSVQLELARRAVARLLRRLAELASAQLKRRQAPDGSNWSPSAAAAQVLLARAWLRGATNPSAPLAEQFQEVLSEEQDPRSAIESRVASWGELSSASNYLHDKLRTLLRKSLELPLGAGAPIMDAGAVAGALRDFARDLYGIRAPQDATFPKGMEEYERLVKLAHQTERQLRQIPGREAAALSTQKRKVRAYLRKSTLPHHIAKVDQALEGVGSKLIQAAPVEREVYGRARARVADANLLAEGSSEWDVLKRYLLAVDPMEEARAITLNRVLDAPVLNLSISLDALEKAETAIQRAYDIARAFVEANQSDGDLSLVQAFGRRLTTAAESFERRLEEAA